MCSLVTGKGKKQRMESGEVDIMEILLGFVQLQKLMWELKSISISILFFFIVISVHITLQDLIASNIFFIFLDNEA